MRKYILTGFGFDVIKFSFIVHWQRIHYYLAIFPACLIFENE